MAAKAANTARNYSDNKTAYRGKGRAPGKQSWLIGRRKKKLELGIRRSRAGKEGKAR